MCEGEEIVVTPGFAVVLLGIEDSKEYDTGGPRIMMEMLFVVAAAVAEGVKSAALQMLACLFGSSTMVNHPPSGPEGSVSFASFTLKWQRLGNTVPVCHCKPIPGMGIVSFAPEPVSTV